MITPRDFDAFENEKNNEIALKLEEYIDNELLKGNLHIDVERYPEIVVENVIERYKEAGWRTACYRCYKTLKGNRWKEVLQSVSFIRKNQ